MEFDGRSASGCELVAEVASRFGEVRFKATGFSMLPAIRPGDLLTVRRCGLAELQEGQIALYQREGKLVAHRLIHLEEDRLITRGDSVRRKDTPIGESDLVGRVVSISRHGRSVSPALSLGGHAGSFILRRSDICLRAAALVARGLRRPEKEEVSWA